MPGIKYTRDQMEKRLQRSTVYVEYAIVRLMNLTHSRNYYTGTGLGTGFNKFDGRTSFFKICYRRITEWKLDLQPGKKLSPKQYVAARKALKKYGKQLAKDANGEISPVIDTWNNLERTAEPHKPRKWTEDGELIAEDACLTKRKPRARRPIKKRMPKRRTLKECDDLFDSVSSPWRKIENDKT